MYLTKYDDLARTYIQGKYQKSKGKYQKSKGKFTDFRFMLQQTDNTTN